jgi:putative transposase
MRLEQNFVATKPNEIWLSDLRYIKTAKGWLYLVTVMDLYSRKIVGWNLSTSLEAVGTIQALHMAFKRQNPEPGLIFHSDRGVQYACELFRAQLSKYGFVQSMSRRGNCYDNAPMESFFHTLKTEYVHHENFTEICQAASGIFEWIECFYNRKRIHSSIGYKTPVAKEESFMLAA